MEDPEGGPRLSSDRLGVIMTIELGAMIKQWQAGTGEPQERWRQLRELLHELAVLRRADHRAIRAEISQERWEWEAEEFEQRQEEKEKEELNEDIEALVNRVGSTLMRMGYGPDRVFRLQAEVREGYRAGRGMPQEVRDCLKEPLPLKGEVRSRNKGKSKVRRRKVKTEDRIPNPETAENEDPPSQGFGAASEEQGGEQVNQAESNPIKVNQTENEAETLNPATPESEAQLNSGTAGRGLPDGTTKVLPAGRAALPGAREASPDQANQGESNPIKVNQTENEAGMGVHPRTPGSYGAATSPKPARLRSEATVRQEVQSREVGENEEEDEDEEGEGNQAQSS